MEILSLKEKQNYLVEILKSFVDFCEKNEINYFFAGGSCLGVVRHQGFIPWDDDIDVLMPRKDYERFIRIYTDEKYKIHHRLNNKNYKFPFAKLCDERIIVQEKNVKNSSFLFLDVFPLDYLSNNSKINHKMLRKRNFYKKILAHKVTKRFHTKRFFHMLGKVFSIFFSTAWILKKLDLIAIKYKNQKNKYSMDVSWGDKILESKFFDEFKYGVFEGINVRMPKKSDEYLTTLYGNYMELPKEEQRVSHDFLAYKK